MDFPGHRSILQSLIACLMISVVIFVQENRFLFYKERSVRTNELHLRHNATDGDLCEIIHVVISALTEEDRRNFHVTAKSVLFHARSVIVTMVILTNNSSRSTIETLIRTWDLNHAEYQLIETNVQALDRHQPLISMASILLSDSPFIEANEFTELFFVQPGLIVLTDLAYLRDTLLDCTSAQLGEGVIATGYNNTKGESQAGLLYVQLNQTLLLDENQTCMELNRNISGEVSADDWFWSRVCSYSELFPVQPIAIGLTSDFIGHHNHSSYQDWIRFDGDVLRTMPHQCFEIVNDVTPLRHKKDKCYEYKYHATLSRRTHLNYIETPSSYQSSSSSSITLVTQLQLNRLTGLERLLLAWEGPASVALYASDEEAAQFAEYFYNNKRLRHLPNLVFHLVFKRQIHYPINYLRNVAMQQVLTQYHLMLDVDFVPNRGLAAHALKVLASLEKTNNTPVALVVPTFETSNSAYKIAQNRSEFLQQLERGKVMSYHQKARWNLGHRYTSYPKWKKTTEPYQVFGAFGYEPYLVIRTRDSPEYSELLLERMRDKLTYTVEVQLAGFQMYVLPEAYVVHMPHPKSTSHRLRKEDAHFEPCTSLIYQQVIRDISQKYPNSKTADIIAKQFPRARRPAPRKKKKPKKRKKKKKVDAYVTAHA